MSLPEFHLEITEVKVEVRPKRLPEGMTFEVEYLPAIISDEVLELLDKELHERETV